MEPVLFFAIAAAFVAYQQWLRHQRRMTIHRERLAAIEKGVELPPLEQEVRSIRFNVQRVLLFAGLIWLSVGIAAAFMLNALEGQTFHVQWGNDRFGNQVWVPIAVREGMQWVGGALVGIGLSHLLIYALGRRQPSGE